MTMLDSTAEKNSAEKGTALAAAETFAQDFPGAAGVRAVAFEGARETIDASTAHVASFVGRRSAEIALVLHDEGALAGAAGVDGSVVSIADVLRPSLEQAATLIGPGVLGDLLPSASSLLFADASSTVFELVADGVSIGWFAIKFRPETTTVADESSMAGNLGRINSVEMALTVEIGRTRMSVRDVLALEPGAVVELDRSVGSPADILLNGRLIAHGEIVVVDQDYAVRITRILDGSEAVS